MEESIATSQSWVLQALYIIAPFLAGGGIYKLVSVLLNWRKPAADIHKTEAETRQIHAESDATRADIIEKFMIRLDKMQLRVDEVVVERDQYKTRSDLQQIELTMRDHDIKKLKGILDSKGIRLSDYDHWGEN